jgi:predicted metal-dependent peptidase
MAAYRDSAERSPVSAARVVAARIEKALRLVTVPFPHLAGLVAATRVSVDDRLPTMGVFASGRLAVNATFASRLNDRDLVFVLAHEMLHLALRTHDRAKGSARLEFNYAHDYIINDMLRTELGVHTIPANGLDMPGAREKSAEEIVLEMRRNADGMTSRSRVWEGAQVSARERFGGGSTGGGGDDGGDVLADELERTWYPEDAATQRERAERMRSLAARSLALEQAMDAMRGRRGTSAGASSQSVTALRGMYRPPWQLAMQRWMESVAPGDRTFTRPSRRSAPQPDVVLAGRKREGWLLTIVLDTSGSMTDVLPRVLGAIADYCDAVGVDQVRLVQCDVALTADEWLPPEELARHEIRGFGGSDLSPALRHLADDPRTRAVAVITDGDIAYPADSMPYDVLWVLTASPIAFDPAYGRVVALQ